MKSKSHNGFSLMSMLVTLLLGSFLLVGALQLLSQIQFQDQKILTHTLNLKSILSTALILKKAKLMSLPRPCLVESSHHLKILSALPLPFSTRHQVIGQVRAREWGLSKAGSGQWQPGGEGIYYRRIGLNPVVLKGITKGKKQLRLPRTLLLSSKDWVALSDCHKALIARVIKRRLFSQYQQVTLNHSLPISFSHLVRLYVIEPVVFYVGQTLARGTKHQRQLSLYGQDFSRRFELVPGIDHLSILANQKINLQSNTLRVSL